MTVEVSALNPPGINPATNYMDSWLGPDQPFFLGDNWYTEMDSSANATAADLASVLNTGGGGAAFGKAGLGTAAFDTKFFPATVYLPLVVSRGLARGLFSQFKLLTVSGGLTSDMGPFVGGMPNVNTGYWLDVSCESVAVTLYRGLSQAYVSLVPTVFNYSLGDVIRLEITFGGPSNTLRSYQNGVLRNTFVDSSALRPRSGGYGLFFLGWANSGQVNITDFSGGVL